MAVNNKESDGIVGIGIAVVAVLLLAPLVYLRYASQVTAFVTVASQALIAPFLWLDQYASLWDSVSAFRLSKQQLSSEGVRVMLAQAGAPMSWVILVATVLLAVSVFRRSLKSGMVKLDGKGLINFQANHWAAARSMKDVDLLGKDAEHVFGRVPLTPGEFSISQRIARDVQCVRYDPNTGDEDWYDEIAPDNATGVKQAIPFELIGKQQILLMRAWFDRERAQTVFVEQLGPKFTSYKKMPPHYQAITALLLAHGCGKPTLAKSVSFELVDLIGSPGPECKKAWEECKAHQIGKQMLSLARNEHAYNTTVLRRLLGEAKRRGGKLPAMFVWLKALDWPLYVMMNEDGRRVAWAESAGIRSQFDAETTLAKENKERARNGEPPIVLSRPYIESAIDALKGFLDKTGAIVTQGTRKSDARLLKEV